MPGLRPAFRDGAAAARPAPLRPAGARPEPGRRPARRDPAPSRLAYRLHRLWLTPLYRRAFRVGLPAFLIALVAGLWLSDPVRRAELAGRVDAVVDEVQHRDAFMVHAMRIDGASPTVDGALRAMLPAGLPVSSFDLDLEALRARALKLDAVEAIELRILPDGVLSATVRERVPALMWRHARGIDLIDATGHRVASAEGREARPDLPLVAGEGADRAAAEALALIDAAGPILPRLRGLERIGERRWDVALDGGQRILLPAAAPLPALEAALALEAGPGLLGRDVALLDLRDPERPVARLGLDAQNALRRARGEPELGPDGQPILPEEGAEAGAAPAAGAAAGGGTHNDKKAGRKPAA